MQCCRVHKFTIFLLFVIYFLPYCKDDDGGVKKEEYCSLVRPVFASIAAVNVTPRIHYA